MAELAEAETLINQQNEEIEELEEQAETLVYAVCQNCGELNKMDWEYVNEEIELEDTLCPSCGYNLMPLTQLLEEWDKADKFTILVGCWQ